MFIRPSISIITGYLGLMIGGMFGAEIFIYLFGMIGVLSPGLFLLELIYREMEKNKKDNNM
ncbi:hypothetical protein [Alkalibaculum sporogenes]|uniref:hypothetical protein n=1 Tax=Alkalibaculum sporogenes TaxID=2655001 RepID=UPI00187B93F1|nr:hypothetical protein [Alkalibaculum sporogenes]